MLDAIEAFADHVVGSGFDDIPDAAVRAAKIFILDSLGVGLAGSTGPYLGELIAAHQALYPATETVRVWGRAERLVAPSAAMAVGYQIHNSEFDCVHEAAVIHPMTVLLASVMAHADRARGVSGRALIRAAVLGVDVACNLGVACRSGLRFFRPATAGAFAAVAGHGVVRGFDRATLLAAFGHGFGQLCGTMQPHSEGSPLLGMQIGFNARNAMVAADMAAAGIPSIAGVLEGPYGYFGMIESDGDIRAVLPSLGKTWRITEVAHKPYPSGRATHGITDAAMTLQREHGFAAADIDRIEAMVPPLTFQLVGRPVRDGMTVNYARLNGQYAAARGLIRGFLGIEDFRPEAIADPETIGLARRIAIREDGNPDRNALSPVSVTVHLKDGQRHAVTLDTIYGNPAKPLSREAHEEKFRRNYAASAAVLRPGGDDDLIAMVDDLESLPDVRALIDRLVP
jgi:aconitate decarboxylase